MLRVLVLLLQTAALVLLGGVDAMWLGLLVALPAGRLAAAWLWWVTRCRPEARPGWLLLAILATSIQLRWEPPRP